VLSVPANSKDAEAVALQQSGLAAVPVSRYVIFLLIAGVGCAADLISKSLIFGWWGPDNAAVWWLIDGYVGIQTTVNQGALFGVGQGFSFFFAALSVIAAVGIVLWLFYFRAAHDLLLTLALSSVTGGIFGNLYDRLGLWHDADAAAHLQYGVRDWILLRYKTHDWPNFNIADVMLVCGAGLLLLHAFWHHEPQAEKAAAEE
jgi:signal peptidase II